MTSDLATVKPRVRNLPSLIARSGPRVIRLGRVVMPSGERLIAPEASAYRRTSAQASRSNWPPHGTIRSSAGMTAPLRPAMPCQQVMPVCDSAETVEAQCISAVGDVVLKIGTSLSRGDPRLSDLKCSGGNCAIMLILRQDIRGSRAWRARGGGA